MVGGYLNGDEPVGLAWVVLKGFLRLTTNPNIFPTPMPLRTALNRVETWVKHPGIILVQETKRHWLILRTLLEEAGTAGNLTTDAHREEVLIQFLLTGAARSCSFFFLEFCNLLFLFILFAHSKEDGVAGSLISPSLEGGDQACSESVEEGRGCKTLVCHHISPSPFPLPSRERVFQYFGFPGMVSSVELHDLTLFPDLSAMFS